jgi:hypothetical protein
VPPVFQASRGYLLMRPLAEVEARPMDDPEPAEIGFVPGRPRHVRETRR